MKRERVTNIAASVKQRLLNLSKERGEDPNLLFTRYAAERFLYRLSQSQQADRLVGSIRATFKQRHVGLPSDTPVALTDEFGTNPLKQAQWQAFLNRTVLQEPCEQDLRVVVSKLAEFLTKPLSAVRTGGPFVKRWPAGGPWE